jgi:predicted nucleotidyltransferase
MVTLMKFRDRDAPVTPEGLIFRTYGYDHPPSSCFCDLEYAPETLYWTEEPRALREGLPTNYYKFYFDGGLRFAMNYQPPYRLLHRPLNRTLVGVRSEQMSHVVRPDERLREIMHTDGDPLIEAAREVLDLIIDCSTLRLRDFGVFGSIAHSFHNPKYSDIDLIIYGSRELRELMTALEGLYGEGSLRNEFWGWTPEAPPAHWNFTHYSKEEYGWYQMQKLIYATYQSKGLGRTVKVEFEPVRRWDEIHNEYGTTVGIERLDRVEAIGEILSSDEAGFMPSLYPVKLREIDADIDHQDVSRIVSYVEEFRLQLEPGETALVRGNLERVEARDGEFHQITLSYGPDYFNQVLKALGTSS